MLLALGACSRSREATPAPAPPPPDAAPKAVFPPDAAPISPTAIDAGVVTTAVDAGTTQEVQHIKGKRGGHPDAGPTARAAPDAGPPEPELPRGTTWKVSSGDTVGFALTVDSPAPIAAGATAHFAIEVTPKDGRKINWCAAGEKDCQPFPTKLTVTPPAGLTVAKSVYTEKDLAIDHKHIAIDLAVTGTTAGAYSMSGDLKFAVCTDAECEPKRVKLVFTLGVR